MNHCGQNDTIKDRPATQRTKQVAVHAVNSHEAAGHCPALRNVDFRSAHLACRQRSSFLGNCHSGPFRAHGKRCSFIQRLRRLALNAGNTSTLLRARWRGAPLIAANAVVPSQAIIRTSHHRAAVRPEASCALAARKRRHLRQPADKSSLPYHVPCGDCIFGSAAIAART